MSKQTEPDRIENAETKRKRRILKVNDEEEKRIIENGKNTIVTVEMTYTDYKSILKWVETRYKNAIKNREKYHEKKRESGEYDDEDIQCKSRREPPKIVMKLVSKDISEE